MEPTPATYRRIDIEIRLTTAREIATAAVHTLRLALATSAASGVLPLVDRIEDFFSIIDAVALTAARARAAESHVDAYELATDAYHLALAARSEAQQRASQSTRG